MPTITLTIDEEALAALAAGEAVQLTATLRRKRTKKPAALTPEQEALHHAVSHAVVQAMGAGAPIARIWTEIKKHLAGEHPEDVLEALDIALDWCTGAPDKVVWFAKDYGFWRGLVGRGWMAMESDRAAWRRARGLP